MASADHLLARLPQPRKDWAEALHWRWRRLGRRQTAYGVALTQHPGVAADYLAASGRSPELADVFLSQRKTIWFHY